MANTEFTMRLLAALGAGLLIGFERQWNHKSAGLRTNTLVSVGAAIFVLLSILVTERSGGDVTRIIGQVVTGIGFLCAGIIFKEGLSVHGLTTAVTVWCCSAIGCLAAAGYFYETFIATFFIIGVNLILKPIDEWLTKRKIGD
jgi:putative Mg2+ transporter-C (MgtC) family protein